MRRVFGFGTRPKFSRPDEPQVPADDADTIVGPIVPRAVARPNRALPILIVASLAVHATIVLPSLLGANAPPPPPHEIPVEVVQLPPKPPEKPKAPEKKPPEKAAAKSQPKPAPKPQQTAQKQPPKPIPPKPSQQKIAAHQPPKPAPAKASPPKPSPQKQTPAPETASTAERLKDLLGGMPAVALPGASDSGTEAVSYTQLVLSKLAKAKREGSHRGTPGAASVAFTIGDTGDVAHVEIVRPSGDPDLDGEAIAMVKRGAPYPPPPPGGRRDYTITLRFQPLI